MLNILTKTCPRCDVTKPVSEFSPDPTTGKPRRSYCRPCFRSYERERREADPEKSRERQRRWSRKNWDKAKLAQYEWRKRKPDVWAANQKRWRDKYLDDYMRAKRQKNRDLVFAHYGESCACCGEAERMFLSIDHIANDGAVHRRSLKGQIGKGGSSFFDWLVRTSFPDGFQTLCRNCNWGKHANGGVCPHKTCEDKAP